MSGIYPSMAEMTTIPGLFMYNIRVHGVMEKINLLGVLIDALCLDELLSEINQTVHSKGRLLISHVNIKALNLAYEQPWLREFFNRCDRVYCDGMGVMLAARFLGRHLPERYTLADWVWDLAEQAVRTDFSLYLLGNPPGIAAEAARALRSRWPTLRVAGVQHGFFDRTPGGPENEAVIREINLKKPDVILVGLGMPAQERWLAENWARLEIHVAITCGALFEYLSGDLRRGPTWMTQHYLEWLARSLISPRRYAWRYLRDIPLLSIRLVKQRLYEE